MPTSWSNRTQPTTSWGKRDEVGSGFFLMEDGTSYILQEDGDSKILISDTQWTARTEI